MPDKFAKFAATVDSPARNAFAITPNDSADLAISTRALYVGVGGSIKVELVGDAAGASVTLQNVVAGTILALRVRKVYTTGTTASALIGLY